MIMDCFKIPYGLNEFNKLIIAENALKNDKYICPACKGSIILRKGKIRVPHFAHKFDHACSYNTVIHTTAKLIIYDKIISFIKNNTIPLYLERLCNICKNIRIQKFPDNISDVKLEYKINDYNIVDIALFAGKKIIAIIEVRVTHKTNETNRIDLNIPFIEVNGAEILENNSMLKPISDHFNKYYCNKCRTSIKEYDTDIQIFCTVHNISLPCSFYRYVLIPCKYCGKKIIVYFWPENSKILFPKPKTVKLIPLTNIYINTCIYCSKTQKFADLFDDEQGIFHKFSLSNNYNDDNQKLRNRVLRKICT